MPRKPKLLRSKNKLAGLRKVYVSWLETTSDGGRRQWIKRFWVRLENDTNHMKEVFAGAEQTGDAEAGTLCKEWFDLRKTKNPITDVVGVLTDDYIQDNTDTRRGLATGELARMFDAIREANPDDPERVHVYLAPLDPPKWNIYSIRRIILGDPNRQHSAWLTRLKETRFVWPNEPNKEAESMDEIAAAVDRIVDKRLE